MPMAASHQPEKMEEVNESIATIFEKNIPDGKKALQDSHKNLSEIADYCERQYLSANNAHKSNDKQKALEETRAVFAETKQYATQSLASVAYQIHALAASVLDLLDKQAKQLNNMNSDISYISQVVHVHKEKVARREIGVLASSKNTTRGHKIIAPGQREQPKRYQRQPIDYSALDNVGHGFKSSLPESKRAPESQRSSSSVSPTSPVPQQTAPKVVTTGTLRVRKNQPPTAPPPPPEVPRIPNGPPPPVISNHVPSSPLDLPPPPPPPPVPPEIDNSGGMSPESPLPPPLPIDVGGNQPPMPDILPSPPSPVGVNTRMSYSGEVSPLPLPPPPIDATDAYDVPPSSPSKSKVPSWIPEIYEEKVISIYDYDASREDELSFKEGEIIYVLKKNSDGWYEGVMNGMNGLFPGNYVETAP